MQEQLQHAKENWLPQLMEKVNKVSSAFSENFARIGSVGEVALHEEGQDYEQYAIHIKVKFRDEGCLEVLPSSLSSLPRCMACACFSAAA